MAMLNRIREAWKALTNSSTREVAGLNDEKLLEWLGIDASLPKKEINETTYFICMKMLAETMGKLPLKFYRETELGRIRAAPGDEQLLLMGRPNMIMTPATFWTTIEYNCQHYGNAYVWIQTEYIQKGRYGGQYKIRSFWPMQSSCVQVTMDDAGVFGEKGRLYYTYSDPGTGQIYTFGQDSVMHFKTWCSTNGIMGKPARELLRDSLGGMVDADTFLRKFYKDGMTAAIALQYTGDLNEAQRKKLQDSYEKLLTGPKRVRKIIPVPIGMKLDPLNIKFSDAQFFELKKYSALQIAAAFGIKPNQLNDYEKSSYANSEMQQLSFLVDTMLYRLTQYEQEINFKVLTKEQRRDGYYFKFNEKVILRTDAKTQMETLRDGVTNAIYTPNEAREYLDLPAQEGGDVLLCNGSYMPVSMAGQQYQKGGGENG